MQRCYQHFGKLVLCPILILARNRMLRNGVFTILLCDEYASRAPMHSDAPLLRRVDVTMPSSTPPATCTTASLSRPQMPPYRRTTASCPLCRRYGTLKMVHRHLRGKCPHIRKIDPELNPALAELYKLSPRLAKIDAKTDARRRRSPPATPPPPPQTPRYAPRPKPSPPSPPRPSPPPPPGLPPRHPDFAFDTPGAGPSLKPRRPYDPHVQDDEAIDIDGVPPFPTLANGIPRLKGLWSAEFLGQELEAQVARREGAANSLR
ncbi:hypothetical protein FRC12_016687 [Ceratobasidium sp. 428]|nr:hypothetical protein FRC12_016687 [Ceratobasidium sp. 428]